MNLFRNVVFLAALAGLVAGLAMAAMQSFATVPLILQAETYEGAGAPAHNHTHADDAAPHEHAPEAWAPADGLERLAFSVVINIVSGIGFALILVAASEFTGGLTSLRQGMAWGFAGFAVFTLAPGLGLPPELPGMPVADLAARQLWWIATVVATALGLWLIAFRGSLPFALLGLSLLVLPHLIGAPPPPSFETPIPDGLHRSFVVASTLTSLVFWIVLGATAGWLRSRKGIAAFANDSLA